VAVGGGRSSQNARAEEEETAAAHDFWLPTAKLQLNETDGTSEIIRRPDGTLQTFQSKLNDWKVKISCRYTAV